MIKKIFSVLVASALGVGIENNLTEIIQNYRYHGIESTQKILEKMLTKEKFWLEALQNQDTDFGYYEGTHFLFLSDKNTTELFLYRIENGHLTQLNKVSTIVGIGEGAKKIEGDKITPIGVYSFVDRLDKLDQYYGPMAFVTNYPNIYDRILKRTGSGIWLHGLPLNGNREEKNTKGCIAVENNIIHDFNKTINYEKTLLISYENSFPKVEKSDLAAILAMLYRWKEAWSNNDIKTYLSFYDAGFRKSDGMALKRFSEYKTRIFAKKEDKHISFSYIDISPYPNVENKKLFRVSFIQHYKAYKNKAVTYTSNDSKELYVEIKNNSPLIMIEK
ncbi:L,D-transpeptidase Cds6 family protein [Helicobacter anatolicus]|uniref:L,D-transpeptidase Cds6 family protein n=1 Tax=Helicobacter anatolicus TaxID=2905874 RepID=UPI001E4136A1|nr:L,D-transpeptidase family protein [Helicobacter anatolicus]MCE3038467.1 L,D-transpeptidase family protein [Helicobacter anatolicus]